MRVLDWAILMQMTRSHELYIVTCGLKKVQHSLAFSEVATRIEVHILVFDLTGGLNLESHALRYSRGGALLEKHSPCSIPV